MKVDHINVPFVSNKVSVFKHFYPIITEIIITVIVVIIIIGIIEKNEMVMKRNKFFLFINRQT